MSEDLIEIGIGERKWSKNYELLGYQVKISHKGLNEHKLLSAPEIDLLQSKVNIQVQKWNERWDRIVKSENANLESEKAQQIIDEIDDLLKHSLTFKNNVEWDNLKDKKEFTEENPKINYNKKISNLNKPKREKLKPIPSITDFKFPIEPDRRSEKFTVKHDFIDRLNSKRLRRKEKQKEEEYQRDYVQWEKDCKEIKDEFEKSKKYAELFNNQVESFYKGKVDHYQTTLNHYKKEINENEKLVAAWEKRKNDFYNKQQRNNAKIDKLKEDYFNIKEESIIEYCKMILANSKYPINFNKKYELEYNIKNKILIIEYQLPSIDCFPKIKDVKYVASRKEVKEIPISETQLNKMFDNAIYNITLRTIYELFEADEADALGAISFNGWVKAINKATGNTESNCIISIQVKKDEFSEIDLQNVEPKDCFKNLKGVSASKLSTLTPVQPIIQISRTDKRLVEGYDVAEGIDKSTNIAAMDWKDFENLIRELFEKEFKSNGGEVKVTQASRDGGVDAIAFDPDPIRGGKIVIQAKRYTNIVDVAAVRDLYGTVVNEGATKGILVSTADYGPDAYKFAQGKPITLLNGSNLLHLLEKHGHHAKIDLKEAKKILSEKDKK